MKNYTNLSLRQINLQDERFRISYYFSLDSFVSSVQKIGLINPPLVTLRGNQFVLVTGWKRVLACQKLRLSRLDVIILEEKDDLKAFSVAFYENWASRTFTLLEKAEVMAKLRKLGEDKERIMKYFLPLLSIPPTRFYLDLFLNLARFEPEVKRAIHETNMPLRVVQRLTEFKSEEQKLILPLLWPLNQNKQREILEDIQEISRRENVSVKKILAAKDIREWLKSEKLSLLQKSEKVRLALRRKRYPSFSLWKDTFQDALKRVHWPKEVSVEPAPFFEEDQLAFFFSAKNEGEFKARLAQLQEIASQEEFNFLFHPRPQTLSPRKKKLCEGNKPALKCSNSKRIPAK